ncbi:tryptophan halogenase [Catenovulum agarivorans DS-2]|uniref:Tryptophan halogenase n=1 Tax=Catenovulum agarivorans DS-2 TaxID=1328313 RepID=W7R035_9ALTE|nr:tryptophan halogenase family protein [Catenovulum agarivorans]EWH10975.1 tryptophan halogenase [Catenovulum agarivorans DS-2]
MAIVKSITIVGGGSAGWLTAAIIAAAHKHRVETGSLKITLCESPNIPNIGVGEGTWPTMPNTLQQIGISESEFIQRCDVSFKQGSKFVGWGQDDGQGFYYNPFDLPHGFAEGLSVEYWHHNKLTDSLANVFSAQQSICELNKAPKLITHPEYAHALTYGYHLNAGAFVELLKEHSLNKLGVKHILANVEHVELATNGEISQLQLDNGATLSADLFIDCTGFKRLLIAQALQVDFSPLKSCLFADTALATQVDYASTNDPIKSYTQSTAQTAGWVWDIGLPSRRGVGHVFSSDFQTDDAAEQALVKYIQNTGGQPANCNIRKISFTAGHMKKFWHNNCVAVGLSAGFLEPLEASALVLIELSAAKIAEVLPATTEVMHIAENRFNQTFKYHWQTAVDFLKLHYLMSARTDEFWRENRNSETVSPHLQALLNLWKHSVPKMLDFPAKNELFHAASYQFVLYGHNYKSELLFELPEHEKAYVQQIIQHNKQRIAQLTSALPSNRELINNIKKYGLSRA